MMETKELRKADFVTSILLMLFGGWILIQASGMPMRDTYGGVKNVWYVSPALLPLLVGAGVLFLGGVLLLHSIRNGGASDWIASMRTYSFSVSESNIRFLAILLAIITFVFLYIPRVDFFLSVLLFLSFFIPAFFYEDRVFLKRSSMRYAMAAALFVVLLMKPVAAVVNAPFDYMTDVLVLVLIVIIQIGNGRAARAQHIGTKKFRTALTVSLVVPLLLTPIFRFFLYVRLPHEGGIVDLMSLIYFSLR